MAVRFRRCRVVRHLIALPIAVAIAATGLAMSAATAGAATLTVTTTADPTGGSCTVTACSLRQAIAASSAGDTVILPGAATPYVVANGQLRVDHALLITGAGAASTVIQATAANHNRVMVIGGNAATVRLQGLTITGGDTTVTGGNGGGIAAFGPGSLVLDGVDIVANTVDTTAAGGTAFNGGGGGLYAQTSVTLKGSTVSGNTVTVPSSDGDSGGGGILMAQTGDNGDNLTVENSTVSANTATVTPDGGGLTDANGGGGIYQDGGDLTVVGSVISGNTAAVSPTATPNTLTPTDGGGGIFQFGNQFLLLDSTVSDNVAHGPGIERGGGGGILDSGNGSQYLNSTVTGNSTDEPAAGDGSDGGGGILLNNVKDGVTIANMTINANAASPATGGGINNNLNTTAQVTDSIIAANTASDAGANCDGPMVSDGYNLTDDPAGANSCSLTAPGDILGAASGLGAPVANGGLAPTESPAAGSPAIGAGDPAGCTDLAGNPLTTDERGVGRPQPAGGRCDIGAVELAPPVVSVTTAVAVAVAVAGGTGAVLSATASNPDLGAGTVSFQYGPTTAYGTSAPAQPLTAGATGQSVTATVTALPPGTYHVRAIATDPDGSAQGADGVFTVPAPSAPVVTRIGAGHVGAYAVTLTGVVNPEGAATTVEFDYGQTDRLGSHTVAQAIGAGTGEFTVHAVLRGLTPRRRYFVALRAVSANGATAPPGIALRTGRRPLPSAFSAGVRPGADRRRPFDYRVTGRLSLPAGLGNRTGCRGTVTVQAIAGHATIGRARATIGRACRYRLGLTLHAAGLPAAGHARLVVLYTGDAWLARRAAAPLRVAFG